MAKPKVPKKNDVNTAVSTPPIAQTDNSAGTTTGEFAASEAKKTEPRKAAKKPELVKSDSRANVVPINVEDEIRRLAYLMAERRGFETGHETDDWLAAEREVRQRYHQQSA